MIVSLGYITKLKNKPLILRLNCWFREGIGFYHLRYKSKKQASSPRNGYFHAKDRNQVQLDNLVGHPSPPSGISLWSFAFPPLVLWFFLSSCAIRERPFSLRIVV
jgi:hypothetical protein